MLLFLFLSFATGVCFSFLQPISRSPFFTNSLILVALRFAYRLLDPHLYLLSICLANNSLGSVQWYADAFPHPVFSLRSFLYPHFSVISSSWYAVLDMNDEETISRVLTSFRNQSSRFLSHQYHLGGMCLQSLMLISDRTKTTHSVPLILIQRILIPIMSTHTFRMPTSVSTCTITHRFWLRSFVSVMYH